MNNGRVALLVSQDNGWDKAKVQLKEEKAMLEEEYPKMHSSRKCLEDICRFLIYVIRTRQEYGSTPDCFSYND
jgi:hypothetical protein